MKLYIIRHGQTDWNVQGRIQGRQDIPLNAAGRSQAQTGGNSQKTCIDSDSALFFLVFHEKDVLSFSQCTICQVALRSILAHFPLNFHCHSSFLWGILRKP